jgi:hypothetical protein
MTRGACALIVLAAFTGAACTEAVAPVVAAGDYLLLRVAGKPLPVPLAQGTCAWTVTDGTLAIDADSMWHVELNGLWHCPGDTVASYPLGRGYFGTYKQTGRLLLLTIIGDVAVHTTGELTTSQAIINIEPPLDPLTFGRQP